MNKVIRKVEEFIVVSLGKVVVSTAVDESAAKAANEPIKLFTGFTMVGVPLPNGQFTEIPIEFPIENVDSVEQAYEGFEDKARERFAKITQEIKEAQQQQRNQIQIASTVPPVPNPNRSPMKIVE